MMVHLLARGHFQKQQAGSVCVAGRRAGRSKPHCGLPQRKALRADSCSSNSGSFWNRMGTGSKEGNDQWETLIHNLRSHPSECWTTTPKALRMTWAVPAKLHTPRITSAAFHPLHRRVNYWLARKQAPRLLPGAGRPGHSLLITAVVISDSNWQHRELNYHPLREACSVRQTRGLLSCLCCRAIINFKLISLVSLKWLLKI